MHAYVARQPFQRPGQIDEGLDLFVLFVAFFEGGFFFERAFQRPGVGRTEGDELGQAVAQGIRHFQHPAHVADHGFGPQGAEGGDLADGVLTVFVLDVIDDAFAIVLAEIDIEVGHGHAFGVEEALEQQVVAYGVQVGDAQ